MARRVRYEFLTETARRRGIRSVITAHHSNDQVETILHNVLRGTGLRGLGGMKPTRQLSPRDDVSGNTIQLVRPMLGIIQDDVRKYVEAHELAYREDSSNLEDQYTRNRIRQELIPLLTARFNAQAARNLLALSRQAEEALLSLDSIADQLLQEAVLERGRDSCRMLTEPFRRFDVPLIRHTLTVLWSTQQWPQQKMTFQHWDRLAQAILCPPSSHDFPNNIRVECEGQFLRIFRRG